MQRKSYRRLNQIFCMLLIMFSLHAQYRVDAGAGTPLLVNDDTPNRIQVYMVYGIENVKISYTSSSTSHRWYRYNIQASESESISHTQNGTTSFIEGIEEGYGYFVQETETVGLSRFIWIIDYSRHEANLSGLVVNEGNNPCSSITLTGTGTPDELFYYIPKGLKTLIQREYHLNYQTLEWQEESKRFISVSIEEIVKSEKSNVIEVKVNNPPLCDTEFTLKGDLFAIHFDKAEAVSTELYEAVKVEVHVDASDEDIISDDSENLIDRGEDGFSAPVEISFRAYANEPVANIYIWKIYPEEEPDNLIVRYTGEELNYTFNSKGKYVVNLEVSDRSSTCIQELDVRTIEIKESKLEIPNIFTPGTSPGVNDEFKVAYKSLVSFKGWIFNRWGNEMFYWTDPSQGWDGKKGGKYVAPGVYFYVIEARGSDNKNYKKKGHINIIRPKKIDDEIIQ